MISHPRILFIYGIDSTSKRFEIDSTLSLVTKATAALADLGWDVLPLQLTTDIRTPLEPYSREEWLVFNLCEGSPSQAFCYDRVTQVLDDMGFCYTGSDTRALNETQYKWKMKALMDAASVPTPRWEVVKTGGLVSFDIYPAIVKPASEHCSYGITRQSVVLNRVEAQRQAQSIFNEWNSPALIEEFLDSPEYNVSVWGPSSPDSLPDETKVLGISTMTYDSFSDIHDRLCTFEAKWDPSSAAYQRIPAICPAPLEPDLKAKIEEVSIAAYRAGGVRDYGRVDLRLRREADGSWLPMALDINANCGVSDDDGLMNAARVAGYGYGEMLQQIIRFALLRSTGPSAPAPVEAPRAELEVAIS